MIHNWRSCSTVQKVGNIKNGVEKIIKDKSLTTLSFEGFFGYILKGDMSVLEFISWNVRKESATSFKKRCATFLLRNFLRIGRAISIPGKLICCARLFRLGPYLLNTGNSPGAVCPAPSLWADCLTIFSFLVAAILLHRTS